ncbi:MAG: phosphomannomutase/phosphoglucomutase [Legionellaceae bacterium]|nr:phosphomannomutase/phosphoglucomutase [Legionellaceae bacterium]
MTNIDHTIFRAYDIRGIVDKSLTEATVTEIGKALGSLALRTKQHSIVTARDGRLSGPRLVNALQQGILSTGCNVIDIGAVPTPLLYFATKTLDTQSGAVVTGSHNPSDYNGIKMVLADNALAGDAIQELYQSIKDKNFLSGKGSLSEKNIVEQYCQHISNDIKLDRPLKIVVDSGNGICGAIAPKLYRELGCDVTELFCEVDGNFPNHHPDPSQLKNLEALIDAVKKTNADIGFAFDGDGDRLGVITNQGEVIWPDRQLMLFAIDVLSRNRGATIIYDVKSSSHVAEVVKKHAGTPLMWKTGHSFVKAKLKETDALLAGEMSGHTFFKERWFGFDDGIYAGARLLEILAKQKTTSSEVFHNIPDSINTPELKLPVSEEQKFILMEKISQTLHFPDALLTTIDGVRADFADGWGLIRPSNTTPYLVLRFEADSEKSLLRIQDQFRQQLLSIDSTLALPF